MVKKTTFLTIALSWLFIGSLFAQPTQELQKLIASDGSSSDYFGFASDIDGDFAIVGAYNKDLTSSITNVGAAYIYKYDSTTNHWTQMQKLTASDGDDGDLFGYSVAISGDYLIIGARSADVAGVTEAGAVYIFKYDGTSWSQLTKISPTGANVNDYFGWSVDINTYPDSVNIIVGAIGDNEATSDAGAAYIYHYEGTYWTQAAKLMAGDAASGDNFGYSVSISGNKAFVGAPNQDGDGSNAGVVYRVYQDGSNWVVSNTGFNAGETVAGDYFGFSVKMKNNWAIIGSYGNDSLGANAGAAYVYYYQYYPPYGGLPGFYMWTEKSMLLASDGFADDRFGWSVDIDENERAIVGAYRNDNDNNDEGAAYVYKYADYNWSELIKLTGSNGQYQGYFGKSVAIDGNNAVIGAYMHDSVAYNAGIAYIFGYTPAPVFTLQANNQQDICLNDTIYKKVEASDVSTYRWQVNEGSGFVDLTDNATYSGSNTDSLIIKGVVSSMDNYLYRCYAENITDTVVSDTTVLTVDGISPTLICISDTTIQLASGETEYVVQGTELNPVIFDNCEINSISNNINSDTTLTGEHFGIGNTAISWVVSDNNGNISNCTFIVQVDEYTNNTSLQTENISIFPNPTNGIITFNFGEYNVKQLSVLDFTGKTLIEKTNINKREVLDIKNLKNGVYIIKVQTDNQVYMSKIVKE